MQNSYSGEKLSSAKKIYALLCVQNIWHMSHVSKTLYSSHDNIRKYSCCAKGVLALSIFTFAWCLSYSLILSIRIIICICMYIIFAFYSLISCILTHSFYLSSSICIYNPSPFFFFCFKSIPLIHYCVIALVINRNEILNTLKEREFAGTGF